MVKDTIPFSDFAKLDLRVGKVVSAENIEGSEKLVRLEVDLGQEIGERQILAGLKKWYKPDDLVGKKFIIVANLQPKMMPSFAKASEGKGEESQGMMLACCNDKDEPILIPVNKKVKEGSVVR